VSVIRSKKRLCEGVGVAIAEVQPSSQVIRSLMRRRRRSEGGGMFRDDGCRRLLVRFGGGK
jgi:hypothetical protein